MIFQKEFEYTDDAYDAALEITEKKIFRKLNMITIAVMAVFLIILIIVSLISKVYALLIIGLALILVAGISYVFRSADLKTFIESYSPEAWRKKFLRRYLVTMYDDRIDVVLYNRDGAYNEQADGFPPRSEYSYPEEDEFYIGEDGETAFVLDSRPKEQKSEFVFDYDPLTCRCYESEEAFLIFRKIYDCMPILKDQLTDEDLWVLRSYFSERMGKKYIRML